MDKFIKNILLFSTLAFAITWTIAFFISWCINNGTIEKSQVSLFHSFAALGPTIAAFISAYSLYGRQGIRKLIARLLLIRLDKQSFVIILSPLIFFLVGLLCYRIFKPVFFDFGKFADNNWNSASNFFLWLLPSMTYGIFEEIGWRGYLLPHLQTKFTAWKATIILTIIWAMWHIPFFFYRFDFSLVIAIGFFFGIFVGSIILTSIYNTNKGFIFPVIAFHFLNNICSEVDKEIIVAFLSTGFVFIAIFIYKKYGKTKLSPIDRQQNYFDK